MLDALARSREFVASLEPHVGNIHPVVLVVGALKLLGAGILNTDRN